MQATSAIEDFFINDLSLWYVRRSRKRFQKSQNKEEAQNAVQTLWNVLINVIKIMAPMMPFFAEENYGKLREKEMTESVHLLDWPQAQEKYLDEKLEEDMVEARKIVNLVLAERAKAGIKVRQPLGKLQITNYKLQKNR